MIELKTPLEIIDELTIIIEKERLRQNIKQKELAKKAGVKYGTYRTFLNQKKISFENLILIMISLKMFENINGLLHEKKFNSISEIKELQKPNQKQRVVDEKR